MHSWSLVGVSVVDPPFVAQQMQVVLDDIGADCIKTGMLHSSEAEAYVREAIRLAPGLGHGHGPLNHAHPLETGH